jgi:hypothetical protein
VTPGPDFDELVGMDVDARERARLERVHELLVQAGPPPELSPDLAAGPTLGTTLRRQRGRRVPRRMMLLAAAVVVLALVFVAGYVTGNGGGVANAEVLKLSGTSAAPRALGSLQVQHRDAAGNWPMRLTVKGLPQLPARGYYEVYLTRNGAPWAPCGAFKVAPGSATTVRLNAPYRLQEGDSWVVTRQEPTSREPGTVVLAPT